VLFYVAGLVESGHGTRGQCGGGTRDKMRTSRRGCRDEGDEADVFLLAFMQPLQWIPGSPCRWGYPGLGSRPGPAAGAGYADGAAVSLQARVTADVLMLAQTVAARYGHLSGVCSSYS